MKVMWITGISISADTFCDDLKEMNTSGGWIHATLKAMKNKPEIDKLSIVSVHPSHTGERKEQGKIVSYQLKGSAYGLFKQRELLYNIKNAIIAEKPDVIDVQGIEFDFAGMLCEQKDIPCPVVYTLQGLVSEMGEALKSVKGSRRLMVKRSLYDNLRLHGALEHMCVLSIRGRRSVRLLKKAAYVTGRTAWDRQVALNYNPRLQYFSVNRNLRPDFYEAGSWRIEGVQRHSIFVPQVTTLAKGGHILLDIISILIEKYPDLLVFAPGEAIDKKPGNRQSGYEKYLLKQIQKRNLNENIRFVGRLASGQMIDYLLKSHVFLQTSLLENSSNALAEAQMTGLPCVATNVGGTSSYVENGVTGMLYDPNDAREAAEAIGQIFEDDEMAVRLSRQGQEEAQRRHDRKRNIEALVEMYRKIISGGRE